jgi:hypothetical protein
MKPPGTKFSRDKIVPQSDLRAGKASGRNTGADSYTAMKRMAGNNLQMESCQPIRRLRDKKKKKPLGPF